MATTPLSQYNKMSFGKGTSGAGAFNPTRRTTFQPGRNLSVGEILSQRQGAVKARYADGTPVPMGTKINMPQWNTSGVGPGTRGYTGSWRPGGYNFGEGTRGPSARTSDEFYAQRDEAVGNPLDNLELGNSNLMQSFLKNAMAEARGTSGVGGGAAAAADPFAGMTTYGPNASTVPPGAAGATGGGDMAMDQLIREARAQEALDAQERTMLELEAMKPRTGSGIPSPGATIDGLPSDLYFQYKANETGDTNRFSAPTPQGDETAGFAFSHRLAPFLKRLGVGQNPSFRRPL